MLVLRLVFPSAVNQSKVSLFEWPFRNSVDDLTWDILVTRLREQTRMKKGKFFVSWHDGEEYCTITNTDSLRDAVKFMSRYTRNTPPLLFVFPILKDEESKHLSGFFGGCHFDELPKDFRQYANQAHSITCSDSSLRDRVSSIELICQHCGKTDWKGDRYACVVCPQVVFCPKCFNHSVHPKHPVLINRDNTPFPSTVLQAVRAAALTIDTCDSSDDEYSTPSVTDEESVLDPVKSFHYQPLPESIMPIDHKVLEAVEQLRAMGFSQDYTELLRLAEAEKGDVTSIIERLTQ